ncbi:MAG: FMN-binding protein [Kiritimatiellaceae bacterium]|nr:FMN-binding protein [Kiritimatiellaceae bacterium]
MKRVKTVLFMVVIAGLYGAGVTGLDLSTRKTVKQNELFLEQRTLVELFGLGDVKTLSKEDIANLVETRIDQSQTLSDPETGNTVPLLKAYTDETKTELIAYAFPFKGIGFWTEITGYIAVDSALKKTIGLKVVRQAETPGLGARIEKEEFFGTFFDPGLDITPPAKGANYIYMGTAGNTPAEGTAQYGRTFDAITGATQTSLAMERMLNVAVAEFGRCIANLKAGE